MTPHERLVAAKASFGIFQLIGDSWISEMVTTTELDWLALDLEASSMSVRDALTSLQACRNSALTTLIRIAEPTKRAIEQALDLGCDGIIVPRVSSREVAVAVVAASLYPPEGVRGVNPVRPSRYFSNFADYFRNANKERLFFAQIEDADAVAAADEIASVAGIDGLFIGTGDLAAALGHAGVMDGSDMEGARQAVLSACRSHGKIPGAFAYSDEDARLYAAEGFFLIGIGNDVKMLRIGIDATLKAVRRSSVD